MRFNAKLQHYVEPLSGPAMITGVTDGGSATGGSGDVSRSSAALSIDANAASLIAHIQGAMEHQKALLARELHDEFGGLLVGAVMDIAWAEQHLNAPPAELKQKLMRARQTLSTAIDLKRKLIEDLRPTLLDNVGLFAALRWHVQTACKRAGMTTKLEIPEEEPRFLPHIPIAVFRIVQEAISVITARKPATHAEFNFTVDAQFLTVGMHSDAVAPAAPEFGASTELQYMAAIKQRVAALGGEFSHHDVCGTHMTARFPVSGAVA